MLKQAFVNTELLTPTTKTLFNFYYKKVINTALPQFMSMMKH